jgi:hypothetical protein
MSSTKLFQFSLDKTVFLALLLIVIATAIAYSPVMFNFFTGDDFVHLTWLVNAVKNPELILRNFHSSWLDGTTTRFYRPLISVFMVSDYLVWGVNGFGFRLTNLLFHLTSSILLYFVIVNLQPVRSSKNFSGIKRWALSASALFALYPLHPEAVSWITGRVDSIVTTFCLAGLLAYIYYRRKAKGIFLGASIVFLWLGLLSKEMALTLPAIFLAYEIFIAPRVPGKLSSSKNYLEIVPTYIYNKVKPNFIFWIMLVFYFGLRRYALGTFVGGYDNSLLFISNWHNFLGGWLHGLKMFVLPVNKELINPHQLVAQVWTVSIIACLIMATISIFRRRQFIAQLYFIFSWLILSLLPVYKIFAIADDLQGSRLAYLATVALCALIAFAFVGISDNPAKKDQFLLATVLSLLLGSASILLWTNNQAWTYAGKTNNEIRQALANLYRSLPGDPQVLFINLPDEVNGAYICRNALDGMTRRPQMYRDVVNCLMVNSYEPIFPFGYLKDSLQSNQGQVKIFSWQDSSKSFTPIFLPAADQKTNIISLADGDLAKIVSPIESPDTVSAWLSDGSLAVKGGNGAKGRPALLIKLKGLPCWSTEFITVDVGLIKLAQPNTGADLLYASDLENGFDLKRRCHADIDLANKVTANHEQTLTFALHSLPNWSFGGQSREFKLLLPENSDLIVRKVAVVQSGKIMPTISFANSGYLGTKGYLHLSSTDNKQDIAADASQLPGASQIILEITRPNLLFESQNTKDKSQVLMKSLVLAANKGTFHLRRDEFPETGIYEARARAQNADGQPIGVSGDHIVISIEN